MHGALSCYKPSSSMFFIWQTFLSKCCNSFDSVWERKFRLLQERQHKDTLRITTRLKPPALSPMHTFLLIYPLVLEWPVLSFTNSPNGLALLSDSKAIWKTRSLLEMHKLQLLKQNSCLESDSHVWARTGACIWLFFPLFPLSCGDTLNSNSLSTDSTQYSNDPLSSYCIALKSWFQIEEENVQRRKWGWVASLHVWLELIQSQIYMRQLLRAWRTDACRDSCVAAAAAQRTASLCVSAQHSNKGKWYFHFLFFFHLMWL